MSEGQKLGCADAGLLRYGIEALWAAGVPTARGTVEECDGA